MKTEMTPREIVTLALKFETPPRLPRDLWLLPWARENLAGCVAELERRFPSDFGWIDINPVYRPSLRVQGDPYAIGSYVDEWGCRFINLQRGVIGEVKEPLISDWTRIAEVAPPYETLPDDIESAIGLVNQACKASDRFMLTPVFARPWERYQFLRGTENALYDLADIQDGTQELLRAIHAFYLRQFEFWARTDVDALFFMDDWGSQEALLISPTTWRALFKPLYKDYCDLAHAHGKFAFMHSDGNTSAIYEDLIEIGVDAVNSQLFCMDMADLSRRAKGRITFWGEIDRQHVLPSLDPQVGRDAVQKLVRHLYDPKGGLIAQFELSPGSNPDTAIAIFEEWATLTT